MVRTLVVAALCGALAVSAGCPSKTTGPRYRAPVRVKGPVEMELDSVQGGRLRLSALRGKPVVVLFFATWCVVCQIQVARLQPVRAALGNDRVAVVGVSLDIQQRLVAPFVRAAGFNFPVVYGKPSMVKKSPFGPIRGVPRTIILDARGQVRADFFRPVSSKVLMDALKPLVKR